MGRRLATLDALLADVYPHPARTLLVLGHIAFNIQLLVQKVEERQARGAHLSSEQLAGLLAWPAAVLFAAREVLASFERAVHGQVFHGCYDCRHRAPQHPGSTQCQLCHACRSAGRGAQAAAGSCPRLRTCCRAAGHAW